MSETGCIIIATTMSLPFPFVQQTRTLKPAQPFAEAPSSASLGRWYHRALPASIRNLPIQCAAPLAAIQTPSLYD